MHLQTMHNSDEVFLLSLMQSLIQEIGVCKTAQSLGREGFKGGQKRGVAKAGPFLSYSTTDW